MDVVAWILSGLLALVFLFAGVMKATRPRSALKESGQMDWVDDFSDGSVKLIGAVEVLGAIGLVLPWALDIAPVLTPLAATGLALTMVGAILTHVRRHEQWVPAGVLLVLSVVVAVLRFAA